jgi:hypothetical protein
MAGGKIGGALLGEAIEPGMVIRRQVVISKGVEVVVPYSSAYRVELRPGPGGPDGLFLNAKLWRRARSCSIGSP